MAKGRKTGGRDWQPGQSGNPAGPEVLPKDVRQVKNMSRAELIGIMDKCLNMTRGEIQQRLADPTTPAKELSILSVMATGIKNGDHKRIGFLFERMFGKVPVAVEHSGAIDGGHTVTHQHLFELIQDLGKEEG
jgi:hypothetical protein